MFLLGSPEAILHVALHKANTSLQSIRKIDNHLPGHNGHDKLVNPGSMKLPGPKRSLITWDCNEQCPYILPIDPRTPITNPLTPQ